MCLSILRRFRVATSSNRAAQNFRARSVQSDESLARTDTAVRLMSQAAHDLRPPLAAVRESIAQVVSGRIGDVSSDQQSALASAIDGCERGRQRTLRDQFGRAGRCRVVRFRPVQFQK